ANYAADTLSVFFNAAGQTTLAASSLTGTIQDGRLPANLARLDANQTFTGKNIFNGLTYFDNTAYFSSLSWFYGGGVFGGTLEADTFLGFGNATFNGS